MCEILSELYTIAHFVVSFVFLIKIILHYHHHHHHCFSWKYDVNITRIESRIKQNRSIFDFFVDFQGRVGDANVDALLRELRSITDKLLVLDEKEVRISTILLCRRLRRFLYITITFDFVTLR